MTKKHFEALASALAEGATWDGDSRNQWEVWHDAVDNIADACARFNPLFDRARFIAACEGKKVAK